MPCTKAVKMLSYVPNFVPGNKDNKALRGAKTRDERGSAGRFDNGGGRDNGYDRDDDDRYERDGDNGNVGFGSILFILMFMVLLGMFNQGEGYDWRTALLLIVIFILYNLFQF
ncbi:hypothetical protein AgCh_018941 [Apium graveolens]